MMQKNILKLFGLQDAYFYIKLIFFLLICEISEA